LAQNVKQPKDYHFNEHFELLIFDPSVSNDFSKSPSENDNLFQIKSGISTYRIERGGAISCVDTG
jgi:hypothetical protein